MRVPWFPCVLAFARAGVLAATVTADDPLPVKRQPVKGKKGTTPAAENQLSDEEALKKAGLTATDGGKLIEYLQQRTLSDSEQSRIEEIIRRFGADDFEERVRATEE